MDQFVNRILESDALIGSIIGALVGAFIAVLVMRGQHNFQTKRKHEDYEKGKTLVVNLTKSALLHLDIFYEHSRSKIVNSQVDVELLNRTGKEIDKVIQRLENIGIEYIFVLQN